MEVLIIFVLLSLGVIAVIRVGQIQEKQCDKIEPCDKKCKYVSKMQYWVAIIVAVVCAVAILTVLMASNAEAFQSFSFASTITSIILSVIAIFMTISGESKTETTKEKVDLTVEKLDKMISKFDGQRENYEELLKKFEQQIEKENIAFQELRDGYKEMTERMDQLNKNMQVGPGKTYTTNDYKAFLASKGYSYDEDESVKE